MTARFFIIVFSFLCLLAKVTDGQKLFVDSAYHKGFDNTPQGLIELPNNRFVFAATTRVSNGVTHEETPYVKGNVTLFTTDQDGYVVKSNRLLPDTGHKAYTTSNIFLNNDYTLSIVGHFLDSTSNYSSFFYAQADTNLNLLAFKPYNISGGNVIFRYLAFCQLGNRIYGTITYFMNTAIPYPHLATTLVKLSANGDVQKMQKMDSSFFGSSKYFYPLIWNSRRGVSGAKILLNGTFCSSDTMMSKDIGGLRDPFMFYEIDTNLALVDTSSVPFRESGKLADTVINQDLWSCIETSENNYLFGAIHSLNGSSAGSHYNTSGLTRYNHASRTVVTKSALPFDARYDGVAQYNGISNAMVQQGNAIYTLTMNWYGGAYFTGKNYLTIVKYDTAAHVFWYKRFGGSAYLNPWSIHTCADGNVMILASAYDGNAENKRDFFIFKIDAATGESLSIINMSEQLRTGIAVYPNPTDHTLQVKGAEPDDILVISATDGRIIEKLSVSEGLNVSSIVSGTYLYQVLDKTGRCISTGKWIRR